jgi:hypothetical protein
VAQIDRPPFKAGVDSDCANLDRSRGITVVRAGHRAICSQTCRIGPLVPMMFEKS